jgi:hypothetical protein
MIILEETIEVREGSFSSPTAWENANLANSICEWFVQPQITVNAKAIE